jgi:hypothetical protein
MNRGSGFVRLLSIHIDKRIIFYFMADRRWQMMTRKHGDILGQ